MKKSATQRHLLSTRWFAGPRQLAALALGRIFPVAHPLPSAASPSSLGYPLPLSPLGLTLSAYQPLAGPRIRSISEEGVEVEAAE
jgi:hypothetical protein